MKTNFHRSSERKFAPIPCAACSVERQDNNGKCRMTKSQRMPNDEVQIPRSSQHIKSAFVIRASDLIRHSTLVIRHFAALNSQPSTLN
jgi:hypothetical protein